MKKKPVWVPEWVWEDYEYMFDASCGVHPPEGSTKVLMDKRCAVVWEAMTRRAGEGHRKEIEWAQEYGRPDYKPVFGEAQALFFTLEEALKGPRLSDVIPASKRKSQGQKIMQLARSLRSELEDVCRDDSVRSELQIGYEEMLRSFARQIISNYLDHTTTFVTKPEPDVLKDMEKYLYFSLGQLLTGKDFIALSAIERAGLAWGASSPSIYRPDDEGANRLYFMRLLTDFFRNRYGSPLREATAALTRCLFDCEVDAAMVAKLAP